MSIKDKFERFYRSVILNHGMNEANKKVASFGEKLGENELSAVKKTWGEYYKSGNRRCFEFYKHYHEKIDPRLVPSDFFLLATGLLNRNWGKAFSCHKANLHYFVPSENIPGTIVACVNRHLFDSRNCSISVNEAVDILRSVSTFVYKPALDSGGGKGVQKCENLSESQIRDLLNRRNFIIQEIVTQSQFFSTFNSSSVNTMRIQTLNLNNVFSVLSTFIRIGAKDSFTDNITGREGCVVGVDEEGRLCNYGLTKNYSKVYAAPSGIPFEGLVVPNYGEVKAFVKECHKNFPCADIINWDIAVDKIGKIIVIEVNLDAMNPCYHQIFNGPLFGDRTAEVIDFVNKNKAELL